MMLLPFLAVLLASSAGAAGAQESRVVFERAGYRLTALGARTTVNARLINEAGRPVPNAPMRFRTDDPAIASVNDRGVVLSRRVGRTLVWAVSGSDSASALLIVDQWASRFTFEPAVVQLDALGQRTRLQVQARDAAGNPLGGISGNCRVKNEEIAQFAGGQVLARSNGVTFVRCADRGIADSVRVEVRQQPRRIAIDNKNSMPTYTVGDAFRLTLRAFDAEGGDIRNPSPTWASLDPRAVNVDPLSGQARAVGASDVPVKIVAQFGDATDTVAITVRPGAGLGVIAAAGGSAEQAGLPNGVLEAPRTAALNLSVLSPAIGDTMSVTMTVRDATGTNVDPARVTLRSSDTTIIRYIGRQRIVGIKEGSAYLVGSFAAMTDSALVTVRPPGTTIALDAQRAFVRPTFDLEAARIRDSIQLDSARTAILTSSSIATRLTRLIAFSGTASQVRHAVSGIVLEERTGLLFGGTATATPWRLLTLSFDYKTGTLNSVLASGEDMSVTELGGGLSLNFTDWLSLRAGYTERGQGTQTAAQQWTFASVGALFRLRFVGGAFSTTFGGTLLPWATYTGLKDEQNNEVAPNPTSVAGEAGIEWNTRYFHTGIAYYVERFTFPVVNGLERVDQLSSIRLKVGLQVGR